MNEPEDYKTCNEMTQGEDSITLIATGYIVPPISKLPFLNIMTDVLLMQVPAEPGDLCELLPSLHTICGDLCPDLLISSESLMTQTCLMWT